MLQLFYNEICNEKCAQNWNNKVHTNNKDMKISFEDTRDKKDLLKNYVSSFFELKWMTIVGSKVSDVVLVWN
jgi:hypothetical protein